MGVTGPSVTPDSAHNLLFALVVDRDADTRTMYAEYLRLGAWQVEEAADGREALAKALAARPDIVITETRLPGMSGYDLCQLLRHDVSTGSIPIIVVTADAFAGDLARARAAGADAVLAKPCLPETLAAEVQRLLGRSRVLNTKGGAPRAVDSPTRADDVAPRSRAAHNISLKRAHKRGNTTEPPVAPPPLVCPDCDRALTYHRSHVGGVSTKHQEQWDYFECPAGCGTFQYRTRTRKLKKV
jgi:two-component system, cell cycle response regulator DivK